MDSKDHRPIIIKLFHKSNEGHIRMNVTKTETQREEPLICFRMCMAGHIADLYTTAQGEEHRQDRDSLRKDSASCGKKARDSHKRYCPE